MIKRLPVPNSPVVPFNYKGLINFKVYHFRKLAAADKPIHIKPFPAIVYQRIINAFKQLSPSEPQHSRILCDLLSPDNPMTDYGKQFLELFFKYVLDDNQFTYSGDDNWEVTAGLEDYDIRIRNKDNSKIIIIENKSNWAGDQPNQLYRYWYRGIYTVQKNLDKKYAKILYLSPSEYKKYDRQSITGPDYIRELEDNGTIKNLPKQLDESIIKTVFFNKEILIWLDECIKAVYKKDNLYYYLLQYKDFWGNIMANEIVRQVEEYFSEKEQWDAFFALSNQRPVLIASWYLTLRDALTKCFLVENVDDSWGFLTWGSNNWEYSWFLNEYGNDYIRIWLQQQSLHLWINPARIDLPKAAGLLKTSRYSKILAAFDRQQESHLEEDRNPFKMSEKGNFYFNDIDDGRIGWEKFAWYAHYRTNNVVGQILKKINKFREKETTGLIKKLIEETKL
jgi:hypothetical protein